MDTNQTVESRAHALWSEWTFKVQLLFGVAAMCVTLVGTMWVFDREPPLVFDADNSYIVPTNARDGDQMRLVLGLKSPPRTGCTGEVRRFIIDPSTKAIFVAYDTGQAYGKASGYEYLDRHYKYGYLTKTFRLPSEMPKKGWLAYRADLCFACNPLQNLITAARICYSTPELLFKVI